MCTNLNCSSRVNQHSLVLSLALLVCGDIHPCQGPRNILSSIEQEGLNFLYARSLKAVRRSRMTKLRDFEDIVSNDTHDCVCVTETWLNSSVEMLSCVCLDIPSTVMIDLTRQDKRRGFNLLCVINTSS